MSKGGWRAFRGSAATAESYLLDGDAARLDEYLVEGAPAIQVRFGAGMKGEIAVSGIDRAAWRQWMMHRDPLTGAERGRFRARTFTNSAGQEEVGGTPLYQEKILNVSKSLSLLAASSPEFDAVLARAMERGEDRAMQALSEVAVTRVGNIGEQRQVALERVEWTSVLHKTSRADEAHYHRHVQLLTVGEVDGAWRALDGRVLYRQSRLVNATFDMSIAVDHEVQEFLAERGLTARVGEDGVLHVLELEHLVDGHSSRRQQIAENVEQLEAAWRNAHPGQEPGPRLRRAWDAQGWAFQRPTKTHAAVVTFEQIAVEVDDLLNRVARPLVPVLAHTLNVDDQAAFVLVELGRNRSAWTVTDVQAGVDVRLAMLGVLDSDPSFNRVRRAVFDAAFAQCVDLFDSNQTLQGVRHFTSQHVVDVDAELSMLLAERGMHVGDDGQVPIEVDGVRLSEQQTAAAASIAGSHALTVVQGAAGAGKTTMLTSAAAAIRDRGDLLLVVAPTKKAALEAGDVLGIDGSSVHGLLYANGYRQDPDTGAWWHAGEPARVAAEYVVDERTVLLVDEAGMLDQDTALALVQFANARGVRSMTLMGDEAQLSAVGRGGTLAVADDMAYVKHDLTDVRRFRDRDGYLDDVWAQASLHLRDRVNTDEVLNVMEARGAIHDGSADELAEQLIETVVWQIAGGSTAIITTGDTATARLLNDHVYNRLVAAGVINSAHEVHGRDGVRLAAGALIATRSNTRELGVANRQTWTVKAVRLDGGLVVHDENGRHRTLTGSYVSEHVELAYAVTGYGAQGTTVDYAHLWHSESVDASAQYVALTRGRYANEAWVISADPVDARTQLGDAMATDNADRGLAAARAEAERDAAGLARDTETPEVAQYLAERGAAAEEADRQAQRAARNAALFEQAAVGVEAAARGAVTAEMSAELTAPTREAVESETALAAVLAREEADVAVEATEAASRTVNTQRHVQETHAAVRSANPFTRPGKERAHKEAVAAHDAIRDEVKATYGSHPSAGQEAAWVRRVVAQLLPQRIAVVESEQLKQVATERATNAQQAIRETQREASLASVDSRLLPEAGSPERRFLEGAGRGVIAGYFQDQAKGWRDKGQRAAAVAAMQRQEVQAVEGLSSTADRAQLVAQVRAAEAARVKQTGPSRQRLIEVTQTPDRGQDVGR